MEILLDFIENNYLFFTIGASILVLALIGYIVTLKYKKEVDINDNNDINDASYISSSSENNIDGL